MGLGPGDLKGVNMNFVYDDGGKAASGRRGESGDCAVRAMAIAMERGYDECYKLLADANKATGNARSARNGVPKSVFTRVLAQHGWMWVSAPKFEGRKARYYDLPQHPTIARMAGHIAAVRGGKIYDTWDCSDKMVYGYWEEQTLCK